MSPAYWLCVVPLAAEVGWWLLMRTSGNFDVREYDPELPRPIALVHGPKLWIGLAFIGYHYPLCFLVYALYRRGGRGFGLGLLIAGAVVYTALVFALLRLLRY